MLSDYGEAIRPEGDRIMIGGADTKPLIVRRGPGIVISPIVARSVLLLAIGVGVGAGLVATGSAAASSAVSAAGADLTRLLRAMAAIKTFMAAGAAAGVLWRFGADVPPPWLAAYALACGAMAAGPALIWTMAHVGAGALLLHGGLLATLLLLWRDPVTGKRLAAIVAARRSRLK